MYLYIWETALYVEISIGPPATLLADNCEYCVEILSINTEAADYVLDWIRLDIEYIVSYIK